MKIRLVLALLALTLIAPWQSAKAADVICYNCPPEWADWASMLKAIKADLNYDIPHDNKNSGQALAQILAEKSNPVGDIGYFAPLVLGQIPFQADSGLDAVNAPGACLT